jgi:pimeloyl-ACP methyl ester carboxylesterase
VADAVWVAGGVSPDGRSQIVLFVHGFNNSAADADRAYSDFLTDLTSTTTTAHFNLPVFGFYWPGDTHIKIISTISYPDQIEPAIESAQRLFDYLGGLRGPGGTPMELNLVGHSLGCRVVLELLKLFLNGTVALVTVRDVALMAAAFPVSKVENLSELGGAAAHVGSSLILYSDADLVLHLAFPPGETLALDGFFPTAVGRFGQPSTAWRSTRKMVHANQQGYGHSDYWPGTESASAVATFLGTTSARTPLVNGISSRPLPSNRLPHGKLFG